MRFTKKRIAVIGIVAAGSLALAGVAAAYFTSSGAGTGTGSVNNSSAWVLTSAPVSGLGPGLAAQSIVGSATNALGQNEYIGTVTPTVTSTSNPGCTAADFTLTAGGINADTPSPSTGLNFGTIAFNDLTTTNQNACEGVTVYLGFTSN